MGNKHVQGGEGVTQARYTAVFAKSGKVARVTLVCLVGLLAFLWWNGGHTFSPKHVGWVLSGFDTPSQFLAWEFFRNQPWWQWPLGANPAFGSDAPGTIVLADTVPLLALFFKLLRAWLPANFQYFGIWACLCFILQTWFGYKLLGRFTGDFLLRLLGSAFFAIASVFLMRVYLHPALSGQWIILAALYLGLDERPRCRAWCGLLWIAALVHAYLLVMSGSIWLACVIGRAWRSREQRVPLAWHAVFTIGSTTLIMWIVGYFVPSAVEPMPTRTYTNLLSPVLSGFCHGGEWSWVVPCSKLNLMNPTGDGFGYFGLGFLLLVPLAIFLCWRRPQPVAWAQVRTLLWPLCMGALLLLLYAIGNRIYVGNRLVFSFPLPGILERLGSVFRGAARLEWPAWYLALILTLGVTVSRMSRRGAATVLTIALVSQCADLSRAAVNIRHPIGTPWHGAHSLASPIWQEFGNRYRHLVFLQPSSVSPYLVGWIPDYKLMALFAAHDGMSVNVAYLARIDLKALATKRAWRASLLSSGAAEAKTFYVVEDAQLWAKVLCAPEHDQWHGRIDGLPVLLPDAGGIHGLPEMQGCPEKGAAS